jgi:hypothetical protein
VVVNTKQWWLTPNPFKVITATGLRGVKPGTKYNGYIIMYRPHPVDIQGDARRYAGFDFKCVHYSSKSVTVEAPCLDYSDAGADDEAIIELVTEPDPDQLDTEVLEEERKEAEAIEEAVNNARNLFIENVIARKLPNKMQYVLQWSGDVQLDAKVLNCNEGMTNNELRPQTFSIKTDIDADNQFDEHENLPKIVVEKRGGEVEIETWSTHSAPRIIWKIADLAKEARKSTR